MARWTSSAAEALHLSEISQKLSGGVQGFTLKNGVFIEGVLRSTDIGNNFEVGKPVTAYYGGVSLDTFMGPVELDLLDVQDIADAPLDRLADYEKAGLITLVDLPGTAGQSE